MKPQWTWHSIALATVTGSARAFGVVSCTSYLLSPADEAGIRDARELDGRLYTNLAGGWTAPRRARRSALTRQYSAGVA